LAIPLRRSTALRSSLSRSRTSGALSVSDGPYALELGALLQSLSESDCHQPKPTASSPRVRSSSAHSATEARLPRVCLTRHLPTPGFLTLLPVYVFHSLPALFHAGNALEVFLQGFFPPRSLRFLSKAVTFVPLAGRPVNSKQARVSLERKPRLQGFALRKNSPPDATG